MKVPIKRTKIQKASWSHSCKEKSGQEGGDDQSKGQSLVVMKMIPIEGKLKVVNES
jgi:hypothetical protein